MQLLVQGLLRPSQKQRVGKFESNLSRQLCRLRSRPERNLWPQALQICCVQVSVLGFLVAMRYLTNTVSGEAPQVPAASRKSGMHRSDVQVCPR
jgi:hypothetical protein